MHFLLHNNHQWWMNKKLCLAKTVEFKDVYLLLIITDVISHKQTKVFFYVISIYPGQLTYWRLRSPLCRHWWFNINKQNTLGQHCFYGKLLRTPTQVASKLSFFYYNKSKQSISISVWFIIYNKFPFILMSTKILIYLWYI